MLNSPSKVEFKPLPSDDPKQRQPNISLAQKELNWTVKVKLEQGLEKTIEYFRQQSK